MTAPHSTTERRESTRYRRNFPGRCQLVTEASQNWPAETYDVSRGGVALRVCRRYEPGTLLAVELDDMLQTALVRVCRVERDGAHWRLGCCWADELEAGELYEMLGV